MLYRCFCFVFIFTCILMCNSSFSSEQIENKNVEPKADKILQQMGDYLKSATQFTFRAQSSYDKVSATGQKLQYGETVNASVRRQDGLYADIKGDLINNRFWYDGKKITMLETKLNLYAVTDAPSDIDSALRHAVKHFGITAPLSDLVISDPYASLIQNVETGSYVGLHCVNNVKCHHLAFTQPNLDWQIWIEDSRQLVPRKIVISYKQAEGHPQYVSLLSDWDFSPHLPDSVFSFIAPDKAEEIEFVPVEERVPDKIN